MIVEHERALTFFLFSFFLWSHYRSSGKRNRFHSERERERGKHYMEDDVLCERNNNNKTAIEMRAAELARGCKSKRELVYRSGIGVED